MYVVALKKKKLNLVVHDVFCIVEHKKIRDFNYVVFKYICVKRKYPKEELENDKFIIIKLYKFD